MKDLGAINFFLGIQFNLKDGIITMNQSIYLNNILKKSNMEHCKTRLTPCEASSRCDESEIDQGSGRS